MKDMQEATEKLRREKWIEDKTKKIKEMTVKGLEPEIQNLIGKHKNEIKTLKSIHEAELLQADERASQRYIRMIEEMRQNFEQEKELSVNKEREMAKQRYEKSLQDEEKSFLEQRRRLYAEIEEEKNRIAEQGAKQRLELDR
jgi:5-azacytidine-induced protein 1